ncbi:MAG: hydantoinase B/oxoprolinase family protein [Rhizobiaceae bacterium]
MNPAPNNNTNDLVTLRVLGGAFNSIAREMAEVLYRMSNSSIIRESEDLGCGIFDATGRELCESETSPMHIGSIPFYIRGVLKKLEGDIDEGDIIIHNHPYFGASHTPDLAVIQPIFVDGNLVGFTGATAHLIDVGAAVPGLNTDLIDIFGEGTLYNGIKLFRKGKRNEDVWSILADSVRTPDMNAGDIEAMIAATRRGRDRFLELASRYGLDVVLSAANHWMDYSEQRLREAIRQIPDGDYQAESWLDNDGRNFEVPLKVKVTVMVRGDEVTIDLTGSADETSTAFNVPFDGSLKVACYYAVRTLLLDQALLEEFVPQNDGMFRPVKVEAPLGSIFNPRYPRACFARMAQCQRLIDCIIRALAPVIPERVTAGNAASVTSASYSGFDEAKGQYWVCVEVNEGSYGARATKDGLDTVDNLMANTRNVPCEELEMHYPLRVERYEMRSDSPGAGMWRGGVGHVREVRFLVDGFFSCNGDRFIEAPAGIFGGADGRPGSLTCNPDTDTAEAWPSKVSGYAVKAGALIQVMSPNSAGYGDPLKRAPQHVVEDWLDDIVSIEEAEQHYGIAIDPQTGAIDEERTAKLRSGDDA